MGIELPNLLDYRKDYQSAGIDWPLNAVPFDPEGLLEKLPPPVTNNLGWPMNKQVSPTTYGKQVNWPKLTIVTPSYNQVVFIETTIRSVLLQNYPNLEYVVIDGGSTDGTIDIIKKYAPWLSFWETKKDHGQGHAINKGFSLASGTFYAWVNSDDYYLPSTFLKVISEFEKGNAAFIYGYVLNFIVKTGQFGDTTKMAPFYDYFIRMPSLAQPACFWRAEIHKPVWEALYGSLDYELWLRLVKGNKRKLIKQPLSVATIHDDAKTSDSKMKDKWEADHQLICNENAHGSVHNWDRIMLLYRVRNRLYQWLRLI